MRKLSEIPNCPQLLPLTSVVYDIRIRVYYRIYMMTGYGNNSYKQNEEIPEGKADEAERARAKGRGFSIRDFGY